MAAAVEQVVGGVCCLGGWMDGVLVLSCRCRCIGVGVLLSMCWWPAKWRECKAKKGHLCLALTSLSEPGEGSPVANGDGPSPACNRIAGWDWEDGGRPPPASGHTAGPWPVATPTWRGWVAHGRLLVACLYDQSESTIIH